MLPSVTCVIPNYNHGAFLAERLASVYGQSYPNIKVLLLDDGSTDNSLEILEGYRHHPLTQAIVVSTQNSGSPFPQWRKGIEMAETEWVWIAESDDTCTPGFLEALLPGMQDAGCVLAFNELQWINASGIITRPAKQVPAFWMEGTDFLKTALLPRNRLLNAGMAVVRRSAALAITPAYAGYRKSGDYRFFAELVLRGKVYGSGQPLASFRRHAQQVTTRLEGEAVAFEEKCNTWQYLLGTGALQPQDLQEVVRMRLVENEILQAIRGKQGFENIRQQWMGFAKEIGLGITDFEIKRLALWAKVKHRVRAFQS
jgi:glycosyltransferase involved in cell wall biosynthesis